ncbi:MAG TPA: thioredoxin domain-containing protein [Solirubrobacteraceae bacterium]|nr:thioredoxin domain-containing protein [Solirubrobacteraceae bacterium]
MASRKEQKEAARQRRLAEEQAAQARAQRTRRMQMLGGVLVAVIVAVVVVVIVSTSGGTTTASVGLHSAKAKSTAAKVNSELSGIPQHGEVLGNPKAKVTMVEYGDLQCPVCKDFALGPENQLIENQVKSGTVKIDYKSFPTASRELSDWQQIFPLQQDAAYAAGAQGKAWNYILLFYHEQGKEGTPYVNASYLTGLAKQIPGLDMKKWSTDRFNPKYTGQVQSEIKSATALNIQGTPGVMFTGPKKQSKLYSGYLPYSSLQQLIKQVS